MILHGIRVLVLLAATVGCLPAAAREPITLNGHRSGVYCVSFSPDGNVLASGSADHTVRLWQLPTLIGLKEQRRRRRLVVDLDDDRFDVRERASEDLAELGRKAEPVLLEALNSTSSAEVRARLKRLLLALRTPAFQQHRAEVRCLAFSPDGQSVASGSRDGSIKLWNVRTGQVVDTIDGQSGTVWSIAFSPDGSTLASGGLDHSVRLWETATRRLLVTLRGHTGPVHGLAFSPDGRMLASAGSFDSTVKIWNVAYGRQHAVLTGHADAVVCVAFSPDGKTLASAGYGGTIRLWDFAASPPTQSDSFHAHSGTIRSVTFSPDGKTLASSGEDRSVKLWQIGSNRLKTTLEDHSAAVNSVTFSPDGRTLATASLDGSVKLWNVSQ